MSSRDIVMSAAGAGPTGDEYFKNVSLLLNGDGTNGAQNNTFLAQGYVANSNSVYFGGGGYLVSGYGNLAQDHTWECWVYLNNYPGMWSPFCRFDGTDNNNNGFGGAGGDAGFYLASVNVGTASSWVPLNTWTHIAYSLSGTTLRAFKNGTLIGTYSKTPTTGGTLEIGGAHDAQSIPGYVSNFRYVLGSALYITNFTPSTTPLTSVSGTSLLLCKASAIIDSSDNHVSVSISGSPQVSSQSPFSGSTLTNISLTRNGNVTQGSVSPYGKIYSSPTAVTGYDDNYSPSVTNAPFGVADNASDSGWIMSPGGTEYFIYDFGSTQSDINRIVFFSSYNGGPRGATFQIQVSNDGSSWTNLATINYVTNGAGAYIYGLPSFSARYVKVYVIGIISSHAPRTATVKFLQSVKTSYSTDIFGGSAYFDGSGDYLSLPASGSFLFTGDYTIEAWVNIDVSAGNCIYCTGGSGSSDQFTIEGGGQCYWNYGAGHYGFQFMNSSDSFVWTHLAISRSGSTVRAFKNGNLVTSWTTSASVGSSSVAPYIGKRQDGYYQCLGYISDLRIVSGTALYTSNFTPNTAPLLVISGTSLLCNFTNAGITDAAMMNDIETVGNAQISTSMKKYGTGGLYFDGSGDYLVAGVGNPALAFGTGNFTIEGWFYFNSTPGLVSLVSLRVGVNTNFELAHNSDSTGLRADFGGSTILSTNWHPSATTWYHFAMVRNNGTLTIYVNGSSIGSVSSTDNATYYAGGCVIGGDHGWTWAGYADDIRITKGYARYTADFTPPAMALPNY